MTGLKQKSKEKEERLGEILVFSFIFLIPHGLNHRAEI